MTKLILKTVLTALTLFVGIEAWAGANFLLNQKDDLLVFFGMLVIILLIFYVPYSLLHLWRQNETTDSR